MLGELPDCREGVLLGGDPLERKRVAGVLHDAVLDEMGMGVVEARADEPVAAFEDLRVRSDESLGLFGGADPFDFLPADDDGTLDGVQGFGGEDG